MLQNIKKITFLLIFMVSCNSSKTEESTETNLISEIDIHKFLNKYVDKNEYYKIHHAMADSLKNWQKHNLKSYQALQLYPYKLDTLVCFNRKKNKIITTILFKCDIPNCVQEDIWYFYGVNIKGKWYFFNGPTIVLPRPPDSLGVVPSFKKLHSMAVSEVYNKYLNKEKRGKWEINESFFNDLTSGAWYVYGWDAPKTQDDWDKVYLWWVNRNWQKRDTTIYKSKD